MQFINIMLSMLLTLIITSTVFIGFQGVKKAFEQSQIYLKNQEIHAIITQYIKTDVQSAGYRGCLGRDPAFPLYRCYSSYSPEYRLLKGEQTVFGFQTSKEDCLAKMPQTACERVAAESPVLILYRVPRKIMKLTKPQKHAEDPISVSEAFLQKKSLALISDCQQGDFFIATDIQENAGEAQILHQKILGLNETPVFSKCYNENAEVVELQTVAYYLATPERLRHTLKHTKDINTLNKVKLLNTPKLSLFRDDFLHAAEEIITDIIALDFSYGVLKGGSSKQAEIIYKSAEQIQDWHKVLSLRVNITTEYEEHWEIEFAFRNRLDSDIHTFDIARIFSYGSAYH